MRDDGVLVNFRIPKAEREALREEAKKKEFRSLSSFVRYVVRKFHKQAEVNKDGIFNG